MKFPYREEGNPPILRPTVDIQLNHPPNGEWTTRALIDSGSPLTVFDRGVAEALCVNIGAFGATTGSIALLGARRTVQFGYVQLSLPGHAGQTWDARVAFVTDRAFQMPFQGILGAEGFLNKFVVTFHAYGNFFLVEHPDDWELRNE